MSERLVDVYRRKRGVPPGVLDYTRKDSAHKAGISVIAYSEDRVKTLPVSSIGEALDMRDTFSVTWINVCGLGSSGILERIGSELNVHPLILEDILNTGQRPKAEIFNDYIYVVLKMIHYKDDIGNLDVEQVSLIFGSDYVISFQEREGDLFDSVRERICNGKGRIRKSGPDYLAYAMIDALVDNYFLVMEKMGDFIEHLEARVMSRPDQNLVSRVHRYKRDLIFLRRSTWPLREELALLLREENPMIDPSTLPYLRDLYEHTIQVIDTVETFRDMVSGLLDVYLSSVSNRMNEVMKVLTIIATIFIPLTFITGIYGMNFVYMPEFHLKWAYPAVLLLFAIIAAGMLIYFRRKKWF